MRDLGNGRSFLSRLGRDARGNTLALVAAAMMPLAGLIGGGVDMSRLYLTKTRLQQACDAGALAGRKAMGAGGWTTGSTGTEGKAQAMFGANFGSGDYGTQTLTKNYSEDNSTVTGTASVVVPMTIMRVFGMTSKTLDVTCTAKMEIPNTDVMFVLDVTGSMAGSKISGLRSAVKCFYEALERVNTPEPCTLDDKGTATTADDVYTSTGDPTGTQYTGTAQIRLGFVPYGVNVNVGKILPNEYLADVWQYQTRVANTATVWAWTAGTEGATNWQNWTGTTPSSSSLTTATTYSSWATIGSSGSTTVNGNSLTNAPTGKNSSTCPALNTKGTIVDYVDSSNIPAATSSSSAPNYPDSTQTLTYTQNDNHTVSGYKYTWSSSTCRLQKGTRTYTLNRTGQSTKPISWTSYEKFVNWVYKRAPLDVSGLKLGGSSWGSTVQVPTGTTTGPSVTLSGSTSSGTFPIVSNLTATWDGCIEEAHTFQNTDGNAADDWNPAPSDALDLQVDLIPNATHFPALPSSWDPRDQWGPMLKPGNSSNAVWPHYSSSCDNSSGNATCTWTDEIATTSGTGATTAQPSSMKSVDYYCSAPARRLREYKASTDVTDFVAYVNTLQANDVGTYHDIGMIWGGRLLSPTGIFAEDNDFTASGRPIKRHLIFMTDGSADAFYGNYTPYGIGCQDGKRQFQTCQTTANQMNLAREALVNARLVALCDQIKNMNITLWVISYGGGVATADGARLNTCATPGKYFEAANGGALINSFRQIASEISELRLTN